LIELIEYCNIFLPGISTLEQGCIFLVPHIHRHVCVLCCLFTAVRAIFQLSGDCHHYRTANLHLCLALIALSSEGSFTRLLRHGTSVVKVISKSPVILLKAALLAKEQITTHFNVLGLTRLERAGFKLTTPRCQARALPQGYRSRDLGFCTSPNFVVSYDTEGVDGGIF
jgi:hypothetical protein